VEMATLEWVAWFNNQRLLSRIGYITPAEAKKTTMSNKVLRLLSTNHFNQSTSSKPGAIHIIKSLDDMIL
jgi:hypothetical protein